MRVAGRRKGRFGGVEDCTVCNVEPSPLHSVALTVNNAFPPYISLQFGFQASIKTWCAKYEYFPYRNPQHGLTLASSQDRRNTYCYNILRKHPRCGSAEARVNRTSP